MLSIGLRMPAHLLAQAGQALPPAFLEGPDRRWEINAAVISIGRDPSCPVVLNDPGVSHVHAQITRHGQDLFLRDLGSRNGTWVNGAPITVPHLLRSGDSVRIGGATLVFRSAQAASAPAAQQPAMSVFYGQYAPAPPGSPARVSPVLTAEAGNAFGLSFALRGPSVTLGRDPANTIRLDDVSVSRNHAVMTLHGDTWTLCDLQSATGTRKNGERLPPGQHVPVRERDLIQLGETALRFEMRPSPGA
jgi:pSer/pThr/pTyr-binding forkhead associated (FHA) protein